MRKYIAPNVLQSPTVVFYSYSSILLWLSLKVSAMGHMGTLGTICAYLRLGLHNTKLGERQSWNWIVGMGSK